MNTNLSKVNILVTGDQNKTNYVDEKGDVPGTWCVNFKMQPERNLAASIALDMFYAKFSPHDPESELQFIVIDPDTNDILEEDEENYFGYSEAHRGDIERLYHVEEQTKLSLQKLFGNV